MRDASVGRLDIVVERADDATVIRADGEVDLDNAETLATALRTAEEAAGSVVLDLGGVPFMDSSGLKVLLLASERLGDRLSLVLSPGSSVLRLLDIAEVRDRFEVRSAPEAAPGPRAGG